MIPDKQKGKGVVRKTTKQSPLYDGITIFSGSFIKLTSKEYLKLFSFAGLML